MAEPTVEPVLSEVYDQPTQGGRFGQFGGRFVAETLTHALDGSPSLCRAQG